MDKYSNRQEAGVVLANELHGYAYRKDVIVLALPRGGVPVAYEIAKALKVPLDVFIVRKLGVPGHAELAFGAIAMGGQAVYNQDIISHLSIPPTEIQAVIDAEKKELKRREVAYRGNHTFPVIRDKVVILVDDGIATGASMRAAIQAIQALQPAEIIVAVPVADKLICREMKILVDELICPKQPTELYAVGAWYVDFAQTEDDEVHQLLKAARTE